MKIQKTNSPMASRIVRVADVAGTFLFAIQGGLAGVLAHLDPVGVLVLSFLVALGGGVLRDLLIGARPVAAVDDWLYMAIVVVAAATIWAFHDVIRTVPYMLMSVLIAAGWGFSRSPLHRRRSITASIHSSRFSWAQSVRLAAAPCATLCSGIFRACYGRKSWRPLRLSLLSSS